MLTGRTPTPREGTPYIQGSRTFAQIGDPVFSLLDTTGGLVWKLRVAAWNPFGADLDVTVTITSDLITDVVDDINGSALNTVLTARMAGRSVALEHKYADDRSYIWVRKPTLTPPLDRDAAYPLGFGVEDDPFAYVAGGDVRFSFGEIDDTGQYRVTGPGTAAHDFGSDWTAVGFNRQVDLLSRELDRQDARGRRHVGHDSLIPVNFAGYPHTIKQVTGADPLWYRSSRPLGWYYAVEIDPTEFVFLYDKPNYAVDPVDDWMELLHERYAILDQWGNEILGYTGNACSVIAVTRGDPDVGINPDFINASWQADTDGAGAAGVRWQADGGTNLLGVTTVKEIDAAGTTAATIGDIYYGTAIRVVDGSGDPIDLAGYIEPGDVATITGHPDDAQPFNHNGSYLVERVVKDPLLDVSSVVFLRPTAPPTGDPEESRGVLNHRTAGGFGNVSFYAGGHFSDHVWLMIDPPIPPWYTDIYLRVGLRGESSYPSEDSYLTDVEAQGATALEQLNILRMKGTWVSTTLDWLADPFTVGQPDPGMPPFTYTPPTGFPGDNQLSMEDLGYRMDLQGIYQGMARQAGGGSWAGIDSEPFETMSMHGTQLPQRKDGALVTTINNVIARVSFARDGLFLSSPTTDFRFDQLGDMVKFTYLHPDLGINLVASLRLTNYVLPTQMYAKLDHVMAELAPGTLIEDAPASGKVDIEIRQGGSHWKRGILESSIGRGEGTVPRASTVATEVSASDAYEFSHGDTHDMLLVDAPMECELNTDGTITFDDGGFGFGYQLLGIFLWGGGYWGMFPTPIHLEFVPNAGGDGGGRYAVEKILTRSDITGVVTAQLCEVGVPGSFSGPTNNGTTGYCFLLSGQGYYNTIPYHDVDEDDEVNSSFFARASFSGPGITGDATFDQPAFWGRACVPAGRGFGAAWQPTDSFPIFVGQVHQPYWGDSWWPALGSALFEHHGEIWESSTRVKANQNVLGETVVGRFYGQGADGSGAGGFFQSIPYEAGPPVGNPGSPALGAWGEDVVRTTDMLDKSFGNSLAFFGIAKGHNDWWQRAVHVWNGMTMLEDSDLWVVTSAVPPEIFYDPENPLIGDCGFISMGGLKLPILRQLQPTYIDTLVPVGSRQWGMIDGANNWYNLFGIGRDSFEYPCGGVSNVNVLWDVSLAGGVATIIAGNPFTADMLGGYVVLVNQVAGSGLDLWRHIPVQNGVDNADMAKIVAYDPIGGTVTVSPDPGNANYHMRYIGQLWDDAFIRRGHFEQGIWAHGNVHPFETFASFVSSAGGGSTRSGVYGHYLFVTDDSEDNLGQTAHLLYPPFAKIKNFMYAAPYFHAQGERTATQGGLPGPVPYAAWRWGDVEFYGQDVWDWEFPNGAIGESFNRTVANGYQLLNPIGINGPVRITDEKYYDTSEEDDYNPFTFAPPRTRRSIPDTDGQEFDVYPFELAEPDMGYYSRAAGIGENAWFMKDGQQVIQSYIDDGTGGNRAEMILYWTGAPGAGVQLTPADLGREIELWDTGTGVEYNLLCTGWIEDFDTDGAYVGVTMPPYTRVKVISHNPDPFSGAAPATPQGVWVRVRGTRWQRVAAEFVHGIRYMHSGVPYSEPGWIQLGQVASSAEIEAHSAYALTHSQGLWKRWVHRWAGHDFQWVSGNYDTVIGQEGDYLFTDQVGYFTGSANNSPFRARGCFDGLVVAEGTRMLQYQTVGGGWNGINTVQELVYALTDAILWDGVSPGADYGPVGGFAVHTLAIPHEWKANGSNQDLAPIIKRVGCTINVPDGTYSDRPWIAIVRLDLTDDWDGTNPPPVPNQAWEVVAATIFDPIGNVGGYTAFMRLDSIGLNSNAHGITEMSGFPCECPVQRSDPDFGAPPWTNPRADTDRTFVYLMCVGLATQTLPSELSMDVSFHSGWCEYYLPEVLSGF